MISWDELKAEWEERDRIHAARPLAVRKTVDAFYWARRTLRHPPRPDRRLRWATQRVKHGYSDRDWWGFDYFLAEIIIDACRRFRTEGHSHPADTTWDGWCEILTDIETGFRAHLEILNDFPDKDRENELSAQFEVGAELFIRYFGSLWD